MQHIETIELGSSQSSITFSSIPQDYDDLVLKISGRGDRADVNSEFVINFNGTSANLSNVVLFGRGDSVASASNTSFHALISGSNSTTDTFGSVSFYISNYKASQAKSVSIDSVSENNATSAFQVINAVLWNDTAAVTSITLNQGFGSSNFLTGSSFSLYGITAGGDGTVSTA